MARFAGRVYRNARVHSVALDGTGTHAEALTIRDGTFCHVVDCGGNSVVHGLGDAHMHLAHSAK